MNWYKRANLKYHEGDRVRANYKGATYEGEILEDDTDADGSGLYWLSFDNAEQLSEEANINSDRRLYDLVDWMEKSFKDSEIELVSAGMRWETIENELDVNQYETFIFHGAEWDVRDAKRLIYQTPRAKVQFPVDSVKYYIDSGGIYTGETYSGSDLTVPLVLITTKAGDLFPIDGWHRIRKALESGVEHLPAYALTEEESNQIM